MRKLLLGKYGQSFYYDLDSQFIEFTIRNDCLRESFVMYLVNLRYSTRTTRSDHTEINYLLALEDIEVELMSIWIACMTQEMKIILEE